MALSKPTFLCNVTLTCILLDGGPEPNKSYNQHQLWHADIVGWDEKPIDNVQEDEFPASITFWERNTDFLPVQGCAAIVVGDAAFIWDQPTHDSVAEPTLSLSIHANQVCV